MATTAAPQVKFRTVDGVRIRYADSAEFLHERVPKSRVVVIDGGHFIWEEAPAGYASVVLDSIAGNW